MGIRIRRTNIIQVLHETIPLKEYFLFFSSMVKRGTKVHLEIIYTGLSTNSTLKVYIQYTGKCCQLALSPTAW
jgi:hypothetical protein